jgi:hypothetical protein
MAPGTSRPVRDPSSKLGPLSFGISSVILLLVAASLGVVVLATGATGPSELGSPPSSHSSADCAPPSCPTSPPSLRSEVVVLTNASLADLVSSGHGDYNFSSNATQVASAVVGDVLVDTQPPGFAVNITKITVGKTLIKVQTVQATLGSLYGPGTLGFVGPGEFPPAGSAGVASGRGAVHPALSTTYTENLAGLLVGLSSDVSVTGSVGLSLQTAMAINWTWYGVSSFYFAETLTLTASFGATVTGSLFYGIQSPSYTVDLGDIDLGVVVIEPTLSFNIGLKVGTQSSFSFLETYTWTDSVGIGCSGASCSSWTWNSTSATHSASAQQGSYVKVYANAPQVSFLIYGVVGPFMSLVPEVEYFATVAGFQFDFVLDVNAGLTATLFGLYTISYAVTLLAWNWTLWSDTWAQYETLSLDVNGSTSPSAVLSGGAVVVSVSGGVAGDPVDLVLSSVNNPTLPTWSPCSQASCTGTFSSSGTYSASVQLTTGWYTSTTYIGAADNTSRIFSNWVGVPILPRPHLQPYNELGVGTYTLGNLSFDHLTAGGIPGDGAKIQCSSSSSSYVATSECGTYTGTFNQNGTGLFTATIFVQTGAKPTDFWVEVTDTTRNLVTGWIEITVDPSPAIPVLLVYNGTTLIHFENDPNGTPLKYQVIGQPGHSVRVVYSTALVPTLSALPTPSGCSGNLSSLGTLTCSGAPTTGATGEYLFLGAVDTTDSAVSNWTPIYVEPTLGSYYLTDSAGINGTNVYGPDLGPTYVLANETIGLSASVPLPAPPGHGQTTTQQFSYVFETSVTHPTVSSLSSCSSSSPYLVSSLPCVVTTSQSGSVGGGANAVNVELTKAFSAVYVGLYYTNTSGPGLGGGVSWSTWGANWILLSSTYKSILADQFELGPPLLNTGLWNLPQSVQNNTMTTINVVGPAGDRVGVYAANSPSSSASSLTLLTTLGMSGVGPQGQGHFSYTFRTTGSVEVLYLGIENLVTNAWQGWTEFVILPSS